MKLIPGMPVRWYRFFASHRRSELIPAVFLGPVNGKSARIRTQKGTEHVVRIVSLMP